MSGNQPTDDQPGPYGHQPAQGPGYQGPGYQAPGYQGPPYQGPYPGQPPVGGPGAPSYTGPTYSPVPGAGQPGPAQPGYGQTGFGQPDFGQPPGGPQPQYGYPAAPNGPTPPKSGNARTLIIIGAVVLALIVGGIVIGVATRKAPTTTTGPGTTRTSTGPTNPASSSAPPSAAPAADQASAAKAYLEALATGKADAVLALVDRQPVDKTFLTDAVLAQSAKRAPLTDIGVSEPTSEYSSTVEATYKLGQTSVSTDIRVVKQGDGWKVRDGFYELRLGTRRSKTLPMLINGVTVNTATVRVFPGSYEFSTGNKLITYGDENVLIVESPSDYPTGLSDIQATLSSAGEKAYTSAVKDSLKACLKKKELAPSGCPNRARDGGFKIAKDSISWKLRNDPFTELRVQLDYENQAVAQAFISLQLQVRAKCSSNGAACEVRTYPSGRVRVNMLAEPLKVNWGS